MDMTPTQFNNLFGEALSQGGDAMTKVAQATGLYVQKKLRENGPRYARGHTFAVRMSALMTFLRVEHQVPVADLAPGASSDKEA